MRLHDPYGTLVIAAPEYYWTHFLTILIHTFVKLHPQVKLKLVSCNSGDVIRMVTSREADVGIIAGQNRNEELDSVSLDAEEPLLVIRKDLHQIPLHRFNQTLDTFLITRKDRSDEITIQAFVELVMEGWGKTKSAFKFT